MSLNHKANGARHISAEGSAVVRKGDDDPFEELIRSIRAGTHHASALFEDKPVTRLAQPDMLAASLNSIKTGSSQAQRVPSPSSNHQSRAGDDLAVHLRSVAEGLELSRRAWSSVQDHLARLDAQKRHADALDTEKRELQDKVTKLERLHDRVSKELERKSRELSIASATIADQQAERDRTRQAIAEAGRQANQREARFLKANAEVERLGRNLTRISEQLRDEIMARQAAEQAREEAVSRLSGLEQAAMLLHSKVADYQFLNEQLTGRLSRQMALQQDLHARLSTVEHERGVLNDCTAAAQERAVELERELRSLQRRATTLLVDQAVARAPPSYIGDRAEETAGHWRHTSEAEIAKLREERDAARRDCAAVKVQLTDLRLSSMTDELAHARCRDENRELHHRLEMLTRQDPHSRPVADEADLERAFDELDLLTTELSAANDGDPAVARKAS